VAVSGNLDQLAGLQQQYHGLMRSLHMGINYRQAEAQDLAPALGVVYQAMNDLTARHGFEGLTAPLEAEFHAFSLRDDPTGLSVAEDAGEIVGLSFSWMNGAFWFLADLFVLPRYQGSGVGGELLRRAFDHAETNRATNRALITFAYNRASIGLYARRGLFPRVPLYKLAGAGVTLAASVAEEMSYTPLDGSARELAVLIGIDESCLGLSRQKHHRYLSTASGMRGFLLRQASDAIGYAYLSSDGHIGPLAVTSPAAMGAAFGTMLAVANHQSTPEISAFIPGSSEDAMSIALRMGMKLVRPMVMLSAKPFGDWTRYLPNHPGFM
jgi:GNAT superfamily N-acetyltransferase